MQLTNQDIQSFLTLYKKRYGVELTPEEALDKALRLVRLYQITYANDYEKRRETIQQRSRT